jgi:hypothetical protein
MCKSIDNQVVFAFWSGKFQIGLNTPKDVYYYDGEDIYKLKPFVNRGLLMYNYKNQTISYNSIKNTITEVNKIVSVLPLPF